MLVSREERRRRFRDLKSSFYFILALFLVLAAAFIVGRHFQAFAWTVPFAVGVSLVAYGAGGLHRARKVRNWPTVRGRILHSRAVELHVPAKGGYHSEWYPAPVFEYVTLAGITTSARFSIAPRDFRKLAREEAEQLLAPYPDGAVVDVHVCPTDPALAVLQTAISPKRRSQYLAAVVGGILVSLVALGSLLVAIQR